MDNMTSNFHFLSVQEAVLEGASKLGISDPSISEARMLIHGGYFVGQRFVLDGVCAIWVMSEGAIRFFADGGALRDFGHGQF